MRVLDLATRELSCTRVELRFELASFSRSELVVLGKQDLDRHAFGQLDGFVENYLPVVDVSSQRLHVGRIAPTNGRTFEHSSRGLLDEALRDHVHVLGEGDRSVGDVEELVRAVGALQAIDR